MTYPRDRGRKGQKATRDRGRSRSPRPEPSRARERSPQARAPPSSQPLLCHCGRDIKSASCKHAPTDCRSYYKEIDRAVEDAEREHDKKMLSLKEELVEAQREMLDAQKRVMELEAGKLEKGEKDEKAPVENVQQAKKRGWFS